MQLRALEHDLRDRGRETTILSEAVLEPNQVGALHERLTALGRRSREMAIGPEDGAMLQAAFDRFERAARTVFAAAAENRRSDARAGRGLAELALGEGLAVLDGLARLEERRASAASEAFFKTTVLTHQVSLLTFGLSLIVTIVVGTSMALYINRGVGRLVRGTERIAQGDLTHRIEVARQDELGALAAAFNGMTQQLQRAMTEASDARAAAERASRAKGAFLTNMSHEFRTPLTSILCYADLLRQEAERNGHPRVAQDVAEMRQAAEHLVGLVSQVVDIARIESGHLTVTLDEIEVPALVAQVLRTVQPLAARNDNALSLDMHEEVGEMVVDALKLRQILLNLLGNACKFTRAGAVTLQVRPARLEGRAAVAFLVSDTGIGMTPEQTSRIFEEFEQGDPSIERGYGGSGLGLAISRRLCERLGGTIEVESQPGVGTTFTVVLPSHPLPVDASLELRVTSEQ
jgi:signal transduction histidine kinase